MKQRGFTLLEVLVAFTLLAVLFGALFEVFAGGLSAVRKSESHGIATLLAQSKLAELTNGSQFAAGTQSGVFDVNAADRGDAEYTWTFTISPYRGDEQGSLERGLVEPFLATIDVRWNDAGSERSVALSSIVLGTR